MNPLKELMEHTDKVRIVTPTTDLSFSIKGMPAIKCSGQCNIPDGEIYTAPIKDSINGTILFNIPAIDNGIEFNNIKLVFENGKIIDFDCNEKEKFRDILDTDSGSRFMGEFAFGLNPYCVESVKDILFDEKMSSSIHLAIGSSYDDCSNGNTSAVHLDLIQSHRPEVGGGKIYFDDTLIYEDGQFLLPNLVALNRDNLL
jgi:aminopeptidase